MTDLRLTIAGRAFSVTCAEGEEAHIQRLAGIIDEKARAASEGTNLTESRLLLFAALFLADELTELRKQAFELAQNVKVESVPAPSPELSSQAQILSGLAERIEKLASSLEELAVNA